MKSSEIFHPDRVCFFKSNKKKAALNQLIETFENASPVIDVDHARKEIMSREKLLSTGIGLGIAIPHARLDNFSGIVAAVGIRLEGIDDYESLDGELVKIVVMILAGKQQHRQYVQLLSQLISTLKDEKRRLSILSATDPALITKALAD